MPWASGAGVDLSASPATCSAGGVSEGRELLGAAWDLRVALASGHRAQLGAPEQPL